MDSPFEMLNKAKTVEEFRAAIQILEGELANGSGKAGFYLTFAYSPDNALLPDELKSCPHLVEEKAIHYSKIAFTALSREAEKGDGEAMHLLALYYQTGSPPVSYDLAQFLLWNQKAFEAGYLFAANDLYSYYGNPRSASYDAEKAAYYFNILEENKIRCVTRYPWGET